MTNGICKYFVINVCNYNKKKIRYKKCFWFTQNEAIKYKNVKTENESIIWLLCEDASKINVKRE